jgi:hypothetical protein
MRRLLSHGCVVVALSSACSPSVVSTGASASAENVHRGAECSLGPEGSVTQCEPVTVLPGITHELMEVRCLLSIEGEYYNCTALRGPRRMEDQVIAAIMRRRVEPALANGQPVEEWRTLQVYVRHHWP